MLANRVALAIYSVWTLVVVGCFTHNHLRQREAARTLVDLLKLRPGVSTMADAKEFARKHRMESQWEGPEGQAAPCTDSSCRFVVDISGDWGIMTAARAASIPGVKTTWLDSAGIRKWDLRAIVLAYNGKVSSESVIVAMDRSLPDAPYLGWGWYWLESSFTQAMPEHVGASQRNRATLEQSPGYLPVLYPKAFIVYVTPAASDRDVQRAFNYKLNCFTQLSPCRDYADVLPDAWSDYCRLDQAAGWAGC